MMQTKKSRKGKKEWDIRKRDGKEEKGEKVDRKGFAEE
jgi:hypothetical protein